LPTGLITYSIFLTRKLGPSTYAVFFHQSACEPRNGLAREIPVNPALRNSVPNHVSRYSDLASRPCTERLFATTASKRHASAQTSTSAHEYCPIPWRQASFAQTGQSGSVFDSFLPFGSSFVPWDTRLGTEPRDKWQEYPGAAEVIKGESWLRNIRTMHNVRTAASEDTAAAHERPINLPTAGLAELTLCSVAQVSAISFRPVSAAKIRASKPR
jgi:hypothetical protein